MPATHLLPPLNLKSWIEEHRHLLKPPVGNRCVWEDRDFIVMVVGGPNHRKDYHVNPTEELFYQLEGDVTVRIVDHQGVAHDVPIREGELFLLPANVPHSPQRPAGTVGLVVERRRPAGEDDGLRFYCDKCGQMVYEEQFELTDIVEQLKHMMEQFWSDATMRTCMHCGTVVQPPVGPAMPPPPELKFVPTARAVRASSVVGSNPVRDGRSGVGVKARAAKAVKARVGISPAKPGRVVSKAAIAAPRSVRAKAKGGALRVKAKR